MTLREIAKELPEDLQTIFNNSPQVQYIVGDSYYLHYSLSPLLRDKNEDDVLNRALEEMKKYTDSEDYRKARILTMLNSELSKFYAYKLAEFILQVLKDEMQDMFNNIINGNMNVDDSLKQSCCGFGSFSNLLQSANQGNNQAQQTLNQLTNMALQNLMNNTTSNTMLNSQLTQMKSMNYIDGKTANKMSRQNAFQTMMKLANQYAQKETERAKELLDTIVHGKGDELGTFEKLLDLSNRILHVHNVHEIISYAKKLIDSLPRFASIKKQKDKYGEELAGYRTTRNPVYAIPRELAHDDELFYYKLASSGFLAKEKQRTIEGAYYVLIDKSGSMEGIKTVWARSVALAIYKLAKMRRRKFFLRFFDTRVYPNKPLEKPEEVVEHILKVISDGGTNITHAIRTAIEDIAKQGLSKFTNTIILITDGEDEVDEELAEELRRNNIELISVMIHGENETLKKISKHYFKAELTPQGALKIIEVARRWKPWLGLTSSK